jgi:hypothetical protein
MLDSAERVITPVLSDGEKLLWSGRPRGGVLFRSSDVFAIPFSLLWCGFAVFWETTVVRGGAPYFFALWGVPFVLVGLYVTVGRFLYDAWSRSNTYYGLTDQRAIIVKRLFSNNVQSVSLRVLDNVDFSLRDDGSGTITFGQPRIAADWFGFGNRYGQAPPPAFEAIPNASSVNGMVQAALANAQGT